MTEQSQIPQNYPLYKCRHVLREAILRYKKLHKKLTDHSRGVLEQEIETLNNAINTNDAAKATELSIALQHSLKKAYKKSSFEHLKEFVVAIVIAIIVAACVRQMWFELYEIPTGSMRPTFKEHDRVLVSKNAFGINTPFQTTHLNFDPTLLKRGNIIVFSGDGIDLENVDTTYFLIFPGKKRYVKRCMGKPGDTLYFYGGRLYGIDKEGNDLTQAFSDPSFSEIEHIPFIRLPDRQSQRVLKSPPRAEIIFKQMNIPLGRVFVSPLGDVTSKVFNGTAWIKESPTLNPSSPQTFSQFWGIKNFATTRLIEPIELPQEAITLGYQEEHAQGYLELKHTPSMPTKSLQTSGGGYAHPESLYLRTTWVPLLAADLKTLQNALTTSRFIVRGGAAFRYSQEFNTGLNSGIHLNKNVPDGIYEFIDGTAYSIGWTDIATPLPPSHPIYPDSTAQLKVLFNCGIELLEQTNTTAVKTRSRARRHSVTFPARYLYFRDGALFAMGHELLSKENPTLQRFNHLEVKRENEKAYYIAFRDEGAPFKDGELNKEFIKAFGLKIPEKHYLALGDNHANSADSRVFGFIAENNIQGSPVAIFWPPGPRWGSLPQPSISFFRIQNAYIFIAVGIISLICYWLLRRSSSMTTYYKVKMQK